MYTLVYTFVHFLMDKSVRFQIKTVKAYEGVFTLYIGTQEINQNCFFLKAYTFIHLRMHIYFSKPEWKRERFLQSDSGSNVSHFFMSEKWTKTDGIIPSVKINWKFNWKMELFHPSIFMFCYLLLSQIFSSIPCEIIKIPFVPFALIDLLITLQM